MGSARCCCGVTPPPPTTSVISTDFVYRGCSRNYPVGSASWEHGDVSLNATNDNYYSFTRAGIFDSRREGTTARRYVGWGGFSFRVNRTSVTSATLRVSTAPQYEVETIYQNPTTLLTVQAYARISPQVKARIWAITNQTSFINSLQPHTPNVAPYSPTNTSYTYSSPISVTLPAATFSPANTLINVTSLVQAALGNPFWTANSYVTLLLLPESTDANGQPHQPAASAWFTRGFSDAAGQPLVSATLTVN